ncbi:MAG: signal peptide peptidase SppA [Prevotella sp.]|nr:signal peptide peptidase SppA [Prevotella sp.]
MKDFFKYVLATVVGMLLFSIVMGVFMVMSMVGIVASGEQTKSIKDNSVLVLNLSGTLDERAQADPMAFIKGENTEATGLDDMLTAIRKAKTNDKVKGIYIEAGAFAADSYASLQAVRKALADFRSSGKWIVAYSDSYSQSTYYLASVANKVWVNPQGMIDWHGLASQKIYLKDLLEKVGVKMQVTKVGKYKSAVEMFTVDKMSDADREQTEAYINGIWKNIVSDVAASRHLTASQLNTYADSLITLAPATDLVKMKMADQLLYTDQVKAEVKKLLKIDQKDEIYQLSVSDMANVKDERKEGDQVAVYYAFGDIVDGAAASPTSLNESVIDAQKVCRDLEKLANDDDVKAVVVRVNSGGGSAYASEQIWHQVSELKKKKPVVVSMGGMAASGGYYMSAAANWIVAEPTTLTGSIGIFGMFPDMSNLMTNKLSLHFDLAKTNKYSDFGTQSRAFNADELAHLETYIDRGYKLFRKRVADGRHMSEAQVEQIAQGHVWLGQDALKIKLVDQLGGLNEAVSKAAALAKLDKYHTASYPAPAGWSEMLLDRMKGGNYLDEQMRAALGEYYEPMMVMRNLSNRNPIQARLPFYIYIR